MTEDLSRLADLAVAVGANVQPGQIVGVSAEIGHEKIARAIAASAYERGAKFVDVWYVDPLVKRARIEFAPDDSLEYVPPWYGERILALGEERGANIVTRGLTVPNALEGLDPQAGRPRPAAAHEGDERDRQRADGQLDDRRLPDRAVGAALLSRPRRRRGARAPVGGGQARQPPRRARPARGLGAAHRPARARRRGAERGRPRRGPLRGRGHRPDHRPAADARSGGWPAGRRSTGIRHLPNVPTEEVFTSPDPERVEGRVRSTKPLVLIGRHARHRPRGAVRGRPGRRDHGRRGRRGAARPHRRSTTAPRGSARSRSSTARAGSGSSAPSSTRRSWTRTRPATSRSAPASRSPSRATRTVRASTRARCTSTS